MLGVSPQSLLTLLVLLQDVLVSPFYRWGNRGSESKELPHPGLRTGGPFFPRALLGQALSLLCWLVGVPSALHPRQWVGAHGWLLAESSNQRTLRWEGGAESGERDLGSSEPERVLGRAYSFPSPGWGSAPAVREGMGSSGWLSPLALPGVENFQV